MDNKTVTYKCEECEQTVELVTGEEIPVCCGKQMVDQSLDQCVNVHPEMSRNSDMDDACDDGRGQAGYNETKDG